MAHRKAVKGEDLNTPAPRAEGEGKDLDWCLVVVQVQVFVQLPKHVWDRLECPYTTRGSRALCHSERMPAVVRSDVENEVARGHDVGQHPGLVGFPCSETNHASIHAVAGRNGESAPRWVASNSARHPVEQFEAQEEPPGAFVERVTPSRDLMQETNG